MRHREIAMIAVAFDTNENHQETKESLQEAFPSEEGMTGP